MFKRKTFLLLLAASFVVASCSADSGSPESSTSSNSVDTATTITTSPAATSASDTSVSVKPGKVYAIGDVGPGGGRIFITPSTEGNSTNQYFEAAPYVDESVGTWCSATDTLLGASGAAIGTGATNTATAADSCSSGAIHMASIYSNNGFSDWFLPSKDELNAMYLNKEFLGGFTTDWYWSSSEFVADTTVTGAVGAFGQNFDSGDQNGGGKTNTGSVRPVRAFS